MENYKEQIIEISERYVNLNDRLDYIKSAIENLDKIRLGITDELNANKLKEKHVINKIEESLGRSLTQQDLIDIVKNHKDENK